MEEEIKNENTSDISQNTQQKLFLANSKKEISWIPIIIFLIVAMITAATYFIYSNKGRISTLVTSTSNIKEQQKETVVQINIGSPVDHATYLQIQDLMQKIDPSEEVIENGLRAFDIDGDGDLDVLGFLKLTPPNRDYLFSTWHRNETGFDYYKNGYYSFELIEKYDGLCSIYDLAIDRVTLSCIKSGQEYLTTLRYQKKGVGYYRDVDAHVITFNNSAGWFKYVSRKGGIEFNYPPDVQISEKTYAIYDDLITLITVQHDNRTLFEIKTVPDEDNGGGGIIDLAQKAVFLKLSDGTYLSRNWMGGGSNSEELGVFYERASAYKENSAGDISASNDQMNINKNRSYVLFTPLTSEDNLKEIDNIFASIKYVETSATKDAEIIALKSNSISFPNIVTLQIPGYVTERPFSTSNPKIVAGKNLEIIFITSQIYQPSSLGIELYPFGSMGEINAIGGGGYNFEKNGCFSFEKDVVTLPEKIGVNQVCRFGFADTVFSSQGYYILDPNRKYILVITQSSGYSGSYETLGPNLKSIVESVRFSI